MLVRGQAKMGGSQTVPALSLINNHLKLSALQYNDAISRINTCSSFEVALHVT